MKLLRNSVLLAFAVVPGVTMGAGWSMTENFDSYSEGAAVGGSSGWGDNSGTPTYQVVAGGIGGSLGLGMGQGNLYWTGNSFDWSTLSVGDKVISTMDVQAGSAGHAYFNDDRVGWGSVTDHSSGWQFGVQLDTADDGGLAIYLRDTGGVNTRPNLIPTTSLSPQYGAWYRLEMDVTKLTSGLGADGAQLDVFVTPLDANGNVIGSAVTGSQNLDTSLYRGFSGDQNPVYKNFYNNNTMDGLADNLSFQVVPEPSTFALLVLGLVGFAGSRRRM